MGSQTVAAPALVGSRPRVRPRRLLGMLLVLAFALIGAAVMGLELPQPATAEPLLPGVRAHSIAPPMRPPAGAGELAFLAVGPDGQLFATDRQRDVIVRFDAAGRPLGEWGPRLSADVTLAEPAGIAVTPDGRSVYVLDRGEPRIVRLDAANGQVQSVIPLGSHGTYGLNGLSVDPGGSVYAADTGRNRLLMFSPDGRLMKEVGRGGSGLGQFTQPMQLAFHQPTGALYVADWENARVQRWDDSLTATDTWPTGYRPRGVAVDALERVYVPDEERRRVQVFTPRGALLGEIPALPVGGQLQLAFGPSASRSLYALGRDGIVRVELVDTPPPPQAAAGELLDPSTLALVAAIAAVAALVLDRRRRRLSLPAEGRSEPVAPLLVRGAPAKEGRLHAIDGAQGE